jgi:hypothetical protein
METADDMGDVMKKCEGISVDLPVSIEDADISSFDNVIALPLPTSAIDKSNNAVTLPYPLSAIDDQIILFTNK